MSLKYAASIILSLLLAVFSSCAPHRPPSAPLPEHARGKWRKGLAMAERALTQREPNRTKSLARAILLMASGHAALDPSPYRTKQFSEVLKKAGLPNFLLPPSAPAPKGKVPPPWLAPALQAGMRRWDLLTQSRFGKRLIALRKGTGTSSEYHLALNRLRHIPWRNAIFPLVALKGIESGHIKLLPFEQWDALFANGLTHLSEQHLRVSYAALRASPIATERILVTRYFASSPGLLRHFTERVGLGAVPVIDRVALPLPLTPQIRAGTSAQNLAALLYYGADGVISHDAVGDTALKIERLRLQGRFKKAATLLNAMEISGSESGRLNAALVALRFMDSMAATGHLRWAFARSSSGQRKRLYLALIRQLSGTPGSTDSLREEYRLDAAATSRELIQRFDFSRLLQVLPPKHPAHQLLMSEVKKLKSAYGPQLKKYWSHRVLTPSGPQRSISKRERPKPLINRPSIPTKPKKQTSRRDSSWEAAFLALLRERPKVKGWRALFERMAGSPWLPSAALFLHRYGHLGDTGALISAEGFMIAKMPERSDLTLTALERSNVPQLELFETAARLYLRHGHPHYAARVMRKLAMFLSAFQTPGELGRPDLRLPLAFTMLHFFKAAGFSKEFLKSREELLRSARRESAWRHSAIKTLLIFKGLGEKLSLERIPLRAKLCIAIRKTERGALAALLPQLALLFPLHPQLHHLACIAGVKGACAKVSVYGPEPNPLIPYPDLLLPCQGSGRLQGLPPCTRCSGAEIFLTSLQRTYGFSRQLLDALQSTAHLISRKFAH